jgi:hypothetical protein
MPQDAGFILNNPDERAELGAVVLDKGPIVVLPYVVKHLSQLQKPRKSPVTLLLGEAVVGTMMPIDGRIVRIPQHERELYTHGPIVGYTVYAIEPVLEVGGAMIENIVAVRKEKDSPAPGR